MLEDKKYPQIFCHVRKITYLCGANINKNKCYNIPNMATKIQKKSKKYCSLGGIFHIQAFGFSIYVEFCILLRNLGKPM